MNDWVNIFLIIDPSGNYGGWKATCVGNNWTAAVSMLKQEYKEDETSLKEALDLSIKVQSADLCIIWAHKFKIICVFKLYIFHKYILIAIQLNWPIIIFRSFIQNWRDNLVLMVFFIFIPQLKLFRCWVKHWTWQSWALRRLKYQLWPGRMARQKFRSYSTSTDKTKCILECNDGMYLQKNLKL